MSITSPPTRYWASSVHHSAISINKNSTIGNLNKDPSLASSCSRLAVSLLESVAIITEIDSHVDWQISTYSFTSETFISSQSYFRNSIPPKDCCDSCEINVAGARIFFWPPEDDNTTLPSNTSAIGKKVLVSEGFTL